MKRLIQLVALFLLLSISTFAQQAVTQSVITLKTGERYRGEIVMRTDEIVMLKTGDGKRYQFRVGEIEKIKQETLREIQVDANGNRTAGSHFAGIISVNGGAASAPGAVSLSPSAHLSLALGTRNAFHSNAFLGFGLGVETIFAKNNTLNYLPVFIQIQSDRSKQIAGGIKTGYDFALNKIYKGGPMAEISGGVNQQLTGNTGLFFGLFAQVRQINGMVTETTPWGKFTGTNNAALYTLGLKAAYMF